MGVRAESSYRWSLAHTSSSHLTRMGLAIYRRMIRDGSAAGGLLSHAILIRAKVFRANPNPKVLFVTDCYY